MVRSRLNGQKGSKQEPLNGFQHLVPVERTESILEIKLQDNIGWIKLAEIQPHRVNCGLCTISDAITQLTWGQQARHLSHHL